MAVIFTSLVMETLQEPANCQRARANFPGGPNKYAVNITIAFLDIGCRHSYC
jgi:hypothetical protein